ncbi:MAG: dsDNA-binding SOS-regulon protein [Phenylobacterium sp.]|jgi:dsDNA-binding SOS-regulon protein
MAVETRYVVVRGGNEIMTFADKKAADEHDRMLDMADNIAQLFEDSTLELSDKSREDIGIYLAKNREEVLIALLAKKRPTPTAAEVAAQKAVEEEKATASEPEAKAEPKAKPEAKAKPAAKPRKKKADAVSE